MYRTASGTAILPWITDRLLDCFSFLTLREEIGALDDAEDYQAFEAAIAADYDAQSARRSASSRSTAGLIGGCAAKATLWRQVAQTIFALDALDRRKPQERKRRFRFDSGR